MISDIINSNENFKTEKTLTPLLIIVLKNYYDHFIQIAGTIGADKDQYNAFIQEILLHISMIAEENTPKQTHKIFIDIIRKFISEK